MCILVLVAALAPLLFLLRFTSTCFREHWVKAGLFQRVLTLLLWLAGSAYLFFKTHDESFVILDSMAYRKSAVEFAQGRDFHSQDILLASLPSGLRESFLFKPNGRLTRDTIYEIRDSQGIAQTEPFFIPLLSMAAAGLGVLLSVDHLTPLVGCVWTALLLISGLKTGLRGVVVATVLVVGTPLPAWFLRGFHAEVLGALLISIFLCGAMMRTPTPRFLFVYALIAGSSTSFHPTLILISGPLVVIWLAWSGSRCLLSGLIGFAVGLTPLLLTDLMICQPYGSLLDPAAYIERMRSIPEHRAAMISLCTVCVPLLILAILPSVRSHIFSIRIAPNRIIVLYLMATLLPLLVLISSPHLPPDIRVLSAIGEGSRRLDTWFTPSYLILVFVGIFTVGFSRAGDTKMIRFSLIAILWSALFFVYVCGVEKSPYPWNARRFLPFVLPAITVFAARIPELVARLGPAGRSLAYVFLAIAGGHHPFTQPGPYRTVNDAGSTEWLRRISDRMGKEGIVLFDYFPHSVPHVIRDGSRVLGLGESKRSDWSCVEDWLATQLKTQSIALVTSTSLTTLEESFWLEQVFVQTGRFERIGDGSVLNYRSKWYAVSNTYCRLRPLHGSLAPDQHKVMDESPIGLRGGWTDSRLSRGMSLRWAKQSGGIVGPIPPLGGEVEVKLKGFFDPPTSQWTSQILRIRSPWGDITEPVEVGTTPREYQFVLKRTADTADAQPAGVYSIFTERAYDPSKYGKSNHPTNLAIAVSEMSILLNRQKTNDIVQSRM